MEDLDFRRVWPLDSPFLGRAKGFVRLEAQWVTGSRNGTMNPGAVAFLLDESE
jgi:hypothetical protein